MIQIHRLEGFYWVARTEGYARAARAFPYPITQPGVYQQVKKLEEDLGEVLFERVGKDRVILTPAGRTLYDFAAPFFERLPSVIASVKSGEVAGTLRVHAPGQVLRQLLPDWISRLNKKTPGVQVDLEEVGSADVQLLRRGIADVLIDYIPMIPEDVSTQEIAEVRGFIVIPVKHKLSKKANLRLADLRGETFIAYHPDRRHRAIQMRGLQKYGISPPQMMSASSSDTILALVQAGLGFSMVPSFLPGGPKHPGVRTRPFNDPEARFPIVAAWRQNADDNPLVQAFAAVAPKPRVR